MSPAVTFSSTDSYESSDSNGSSFLITIRTTALILVEEYSFVLLQIRQRQIRRSCYCLRLYHIVGFSSLLSSLTSASFCFHGWHSRCWFLATTGFLATFLASVFEMLLVSLSARDFPLFIISGNIN